MRDGRGNSSPSTPRPLARPCRRAYRCAAHTATLTLLTGPGSASSVAPPCSAAVPSAGRTRSHGPSSALSAAPRSRRRAPRRLRRLPITAAVYPWVFGRENPHLQDRPGRRAQAGHGAFADLKGSMELLADRDPEEARQLLDPVLERMMAAVHRYEGTVNQVMGDGIMALFGAPIAHEDHAVRACYAALAMQEAMRRTARRCGARMASRCRSAWGSTPGRWWCGPSATTCTWITRRSARPRIWRRAWNSSPPREYPADAATLRLVEGFVQVRPGTGPGEGPGGAGGGVRAGGRHASPHGVAGRAARGLTRFVGRETKSRRCSRRWHGRARDTARSSPWWGRPVWGSLAWSTSSSIPTAPRAGGCWRGPRCPMAKPRPISR